MQDVSFFLVVILLTIFAALIALAVVKVVYKSSGPWIEKYGMQAIGVTVASALLILSWSGDASVPKLLGGVLGIALGVGLISTVKMGSLTHWAATLAFVAPIAIWGGMGGSLSSLTANPTIAFVGTAVLMIAAFLAFPLYGHQRYHKAPVILAA